ncbi:MAG TPA: OsmC family protein [Stellaceae bacterium]|nr:OsmC family protein [Stellaceae bacterium]
MAEKQHRYHVHLRWTGNQGTGTSGYKAYNRAHDLLAEGKPAIAASSDPAFRGDPARWNPEELLVASLASCHQLWYLHLCAVNGVVVTAYEDRPEGVMQEEAGGAGQFVSVVLRPQVTVTAGSDLAKARALHHEAHEKCFIARSMNFPVTHAPTVTVAG